MRLSPKPASLLYLSTIIAYTILSWIILLRDDWALKALANFYPALNPTIFNLQSWALSHHLNTIPTVLLLITIVFLFISFFKLLNLIKTGAISNQNVFIILSISISLLFLSYPTLSTDIFDHTFINRVATTYHHNPWTISPNTFISDPFINLGQWQHITSVYGPLHHMITLPFTYLAGSDLLTNITALRFSALIFYAISIALISTLTSKLKLKNSKFIVLAFAFNPAILLEIIAHAHNDIFMIAFMLASILALANKQHFLSGVLLGFGFLVKLYAISLLPFFLAYLLFNQKPMELVNIGLGLMLAIAAGLFVMGPASIKSYLELMKWVFTLKLNSLPGVFTNIPDQLFNLVFITLAIFRVFIKPRITSLREIVSEYSLLTLVYLLFVIPLYWPWYTIWILPFALLSNKQFLINASLALTLTSTLYYPLLMISHRFNYTHPVWTPVIYLVIAAPPTFFFFRHLLETRVKYLSHETVKT